MWHAQAAELLRCVVWRAEARAKLKLRRRRQVTNWEGKRNSLDSSTSNNSSNTPEETKNTTEYSRRSTDIQINSIQGNAIQGNAGSNGGGIGFAHGQRLALDIEKRLSMANIESLQDVSPKDAAFAPNAPQQTPMQFSPHHIKVLIEAFVEKMDTTKDGSLKKQDFMLWAASVLSDPMSILEAKLSHMNAQSISTPRSIERNVTALKHLKNLRTQWTAATATASASNTGETSINSSTQLKTQLSKMSNVSMLFDISRETTSKPQAANVNKFDNSSISEVSDGNRRPICDENATKRRDNGADTGADNGVDTPDMQLQQQTELQGSSHPSQSLTIDEKKYILQRKHFDSCPLRVETPYGPGYIKNSESSLGILEVTYHWGGSARPTSTAYFSRSWAGYYSGVVTTFEKMIGNDGYGDGSNSHNTCDIDDDLRLYRKISQENISENDIKNMTESQIILFLPILLQQESAMMRYRLSHSMNLLRRSFWMLRSMTTTIHTSYTSVILTESPLIQKQNTSDFFRNGDNDFQVDEVYGETSPLEILCPIYPERTISQVQVLRKFVSGHGPCLLGLKAHGFPSLDSKVIFKPDEMRSDMMIMRMFQIFNNIWKASSLKMMPYSYTFEIVCMSDKSGVMEFIDNSEELQEWNIKTISTMDDDSLDEFVRSAAGSYVACYVLGCRDRHKSNFMIKNDRVFLQIDFKHCFDRQTRGVDAPHFSVNGAMKRGLKSRGRWKQFKVLCTDAFRVLRRTSNLIITICLRMFNGLWFTTSEMETWLLKAFRSHETESKALQAIPQMIAQGVTSIQRKLKSYTHKLSLARHRRQRTRDLRNQSIGQNIARKLGLTPGPNTSPVSAGNSNSNSNSTKSMTRRAKERVRLGGDGSNESSLKTRSISNSPKPIDRENLRLSAKAHSGASSRRRGHGHRRTISDVFKDTLMGVIHKGQNFFSRNVGASGKLDDNSSAYSGVSPSPIRDIRDMRGPLSPKPHSKTGRSQSLEPLDRNANIRKDAMNRDISREDHDSRDHTNRRWGSPTNGSRVSSPTATRQSSATPTARESAPSAITLHSPPPSDANNDRKQPKQSKPNRRLNRRHTSTASLGAISKFRRSKSADVGVGLGLEKMAKTIRKIGKISRKSRDTRDEEDKLSAGEFSSVALGVHVRGKALYAKSSNDQGVVYPKALPRGYADVLVNRPSLDFSSDSDLEWAPETTPLRNQSQTSQSNLGYSYGYGYGPTNGFTVQNTGNINKNIGYVSSRLSGVHANVGYGPKHVSNAQITRGSRLRLDIETADLSDEEYGLEPTPIPLESFLSGENENENDNDGYSEASEILVSAAAASNTARTSTNTSRNRNTNTTSQVVHAKLQGQIQADDRESGADSMGMEYGSSKGSIAVLNHENENENDDEQNQHENENQNQNQNRDKRDNQEPYASNGSNSGRISVTINDDASVVDIANKKNKRNYDVNVQEDMEKTQWKYFGGKLYEAVD